MCKLTFENLINFTNALVNAIEEDQLNLTSTQWKTLDDELAKARFYLMVNPDKADDNQSDFTEDDFLTVPDEDGLLKSLDRLVDVLQIDFKTAFDPSSELYKTVTDISTAFQTEVQLVAAGKPTSQTELRDLRNRTVQVIQLIRRNKLGKKSENTTDNEDNNE